MHIKWKDAEDLIGEARSGSSEYSILELNKWTSLITDYLLTAKDVSCSIWKYFSDEAEVFECRLTCYIIRELINQVHEFHRERW